MWRKTSTSAPRCRARQGGGQWTGRSDDPALPACRPIYTQDNNLHQDCSVPLTRRSRGGRLCDVTMVKKKRLQIGIPIMTCRVFPQEQTSDSDFSLGLPRGDINDVHTWYSMIIIRDARKAGQESLLTSIQPIQWCICDYMCVGHSGMTVHITERTVSRWHPGTHDNTICSQVGYFILRSARTINTGYFQEQSLKMAPKAAAKVRL